MMATLTDQLKKTLRQAGYRLTRWGYSNRFQAMDEALSGLLRSGFNPSTIIDGGANRGEWAKAARSVFPFSHIHLVEPLPKCVDCLREMASIDGRMTVHPYAATVPGVTEVTFNQVGDDGMSTAAQVALPGERFPNEMVLPASTLDAMLGRLIKPGMLLKLDLQGHEIEAMKGATNVIKSVEVIICEVAFYPVDDTGRPVFADVMYFVSRLGFVLFDFASLVGRYDDNRLQWGDIVLAKRDSQLLRNNAWRTALDQRALVYDATSQPAGSY
jgi:FkbM family methyltransferase